MSVAARRAGRDVVLEFAGAEIIDVVGPRDEMYGDGSIVLTVDEALDLVMEILQIIKEIMSEGDGDEGTE